MPPLRVAIFAESYLPYLSGVTVATDALARGLGAAGHDVLVVAPRPARGGAPGSAGSRGPAPRHAWLPSYQLPRIVPLGYRMPWPSPSAALGEAVRFAPHVVHAQSPFVAGLLARRAARRVGAALVFTHHTRFADYRHYLGPLAAPGSAAIEAYLAAFWAGCDAVVAPSTDLAEEIRGRLGDRARRTLVRVAPTGLDVATIEGLAPVDPRPVAGWPDDALVVASLGRLAAEKSVDLVLEAVALAAADEGRIRLLLVGSGPAEAGLRRRAAAADLSGRVHFAGVVPRLEALAALKASDLFAFASRTETQGLVLAEALSCGLPVVAVAGPGVADSVRDGVDGRVVESAPGPLAEAIVAFARDPSRRAGLAAAARDGAARFDIGRRIAEIEALYRHLLNRTGA